MTISEDQVLDFRRNLDRKNQSEENKSDADGGERKGMGAQ